MVSRDAKPSERSAENLNMRAPLRGLRVAANQITPIAIFAKSPACHWLFQLLTLAEYPLQPARFFWITISGLPIKTARPLRLRIEGDSGLLVGTAMRWLPGIIGLALVLALGSGCQRQVFLQERDLNSATGTLSQNLEHDPSVGASAISPPVDAPPTVDFPDRPPRYLSLQEAIAIALETGTASSNSIGPSGLANGIIDDTLIALNRGLPNNQTDKLRVLSYNPAIAYTTIEASLSRFDPKFTSFLTYDAVDTFQLKNTLNGNFVNVGAYFFKEIASGGLVYTGIGSTNPQNQAFTATLSTFANSSTAAAAAQGLNGENFYAIPVTLGFEQPLLRDFGVGINQLLNQISPQTGFLPGEGLSGFFNNQKLPLSQGPNFNGLATPGILLARLQFDEARAEFERQVNNLLVNTEVAYWKLYQAYGSLYANEEVLRLAQKVYAVAQPRFPPPYLLKTIEAQYQEFRGERLKALGQVLEAERNLRRIIGLPIEDGQRLIPITPPSLAPFWPNWYAAREDALALRPELILARQNLKNAQYNLMIQKNFLKPDLRVIGQYQPVGFGNTLTGNGSTFVDNNGVARSNNAFRSLASDHFDNWFVGTVLNIPLGYRLEYAGVRAARLALAQSYYVLEDIEERTISILGLNYQKLIEWWDRIEITRQEHDSYAESVLGTWKRIKTGGDPKGGGDFLSNLQLLLDSQRRLAIAMQKEYEAIAEYNNSLARFEWAKGTILHHDNVTISEGPLPECVEGRAVENERQRSLGLIMNERTVAGPVTHPGMLAGDQEVEHGLEGAPEGPRPRILEKNGGDGKPYSSPPSRLPDPSNPGLKKLPPPTSLETMPETPKFFHPPLIKSRNLPPGVETGTKEKLSPASPATSPEPPEFWKSSPPADPPVLPGPVPGVSTLPEISQTIWRTDSSIPGLPAN